MAICDALGAYTEFTPFNKDRTDLITYDFNSVAEQVKRGLFKVPPKDEIGIWTDDCSMALCVADSFILKHF